MIVVGAPSSTTDRPTSERSPPKRCEKRRWLITATRAAPGASSPFAKPRPNSGPTPSIWKKLAETDVCGICCGSALRSPASVAELPRTAENPSNDVNSFRRRTTSGPVVHASGTPTQSSPSHRIIRRDGSRYGSCLNNTLFATLKIDVFAAMGEGEREDDDERIAGRACERTQTVAQIAKQIL